MKKYFRINIHCIQLDYEKNNVVIVSSKGNDFALKAIHNNSEELKKAEKLIDDFYVVITENQFMNELRTVLMMAETKAMQLHDPKTYEEIQKREQS